MPGNHWRNWTLFSLLSFVWGSSFLLMKIGLEHLTPYQVAAIRILSGGLVLLPFLPRSLKGIPSGKMTYVVLSGLIGSFFPAFLFCLAETKVNSSVTGMLNSLTPLLTIVIGTVFFGNQVSAAKITGVFIGFCGLLLLMLPNGKVSVADFPHMLLILLATLMYAINVNMVSRHLKGIDPLHIATVAFAVLILPCLCILYVDHYFSTPLTLSYLKSTLAASVLGIAGTAIASVWFYMLVRSAGTVFASMVTYGIPFVAVAWGTIYHEQILPIQMLGLLVILTGVFITSRFSNTSK